MKHLIITCLILATYTSTAVADLTVFSGRKEPLIKPVIEAFTAETGIEVRLKTGKSTALGQQILQEQPRPTADIYIAKESGSLEYLRGKGAFETYESRETKRIPERFKARDGSWIGVSGRSRALIYNKDLIDASDLPQSIEELSDRKYRGQIAAVNAGNESFIAWISGLRLHMGDEAVAAWLKAMKKNKIQLLSSSHTDIRKAVGRAEYPMGLINHYYYHLQKREADEELTNVGVVYLDQKDDQRGELVNVSGAAIVKGTANMTQARQFIDFLASPKAQDLFANANFEFPLIADVEVNPEVVAAMGCEPGTPALDCLHVMDVHLDEFGSQMKTTLEILDEVDWY